MRAMIWLFFAFGLLLLVGGIYYRSRRKSPVLEPAASPPEGRDFETAAELAPPATTVEAAPTLEPQASPAPPYDELPLTYGDNKIVLMVRDPEWVFAYWELNDQTKAAFARRFGSQAWEQSQPMVRVYDTTGVIYDGANANRIVDVPINDYAQSWHIHVGEPDRTYFAELGRVIDHQFICLARSNFVVTPRNRISDLIDEEWMLITDLDDILYGRYAYGISSPFMAPSSVFLAPSSAQMRERKDSIG